MIDFPGKYDSSKFATSKYYRRLPVAPLPASTYDAARQPQASAVPSDADKGGLPPVPQSLAEESSAASPVVSAPGDHGSAERAGGEISPGKDHPDRRDGELSLVAAYAADIRGHWQRGFDSFWSIAHLCAEANAQLTTAQKAELIACLPFRPATFSKLAKIGADTRLSAPEVQTLLPPHYTTTYAVASLSDEELKEAIAEKIIYPDMQRAELQKWRNAHRKLPAKAGIEDSPEEAISENRALTSAISQHEVQDGLEVPDEPRLLVHNAAIEAVASPAPPPLLVDDDIPAFLDRRPLSADDQRAFDAIKAAWDRYLVPLWNSASVVVRERIIAEVVRATVPPRSAAKLGGTGRRDDHASAISSTAPLAQTADAADAGEAEKFDLPKPTPLTVQAAEGADAGIKNNGIEFVGLRHIGKKCVTVLRRRTRQVKTR